MSAQVPKVSIGIPVFNGAQYLPETLDRLLGQTFTDLEIVISDNASTDDTAKICAAYAERDSRIRYFRNKSNMGAAPNFNRAFELSRGTYFAWAAYDDVHDHRFLERCVSALDENPDVALSYSTIGFIDQNDTPVRFRRGKGDDDDGYLRDIYGNPVMEPDKLHIAESPRTEERFADVLQNVNWCLQMFGLIRADVLRHTGLQRHYYGADKVLLAEISLAGRYHQVDEVLFTKRIHPKMSFYQTTKEKRQWIATTKMHRMPQLHMLKDYAIAVSKAPLSFSQRMQCFVAILGLVKRKGLWHKIFVPGPYNYLGINFGTK